MIRFDQVSKRYPTGQEALSQLSFDVAPGEMVFVTGHSGAGKSTLLKLLVLVERPSRGTVMLDGVDLASTRPRGVPALRRKVGVVFQDHRLLMDRSVFANVELPLVIAGVAPAERGRRVRAALEKVGLLAYEKQSPVTLSTGEQQRVGIARAIVGKPPLLIADEPTGNLDPQLAVEIMELFAAFQ
ncbi:MAG TPA: ATP-binding cassette domain-containing protein, partial [Rhodanobacteraceae bacterium]|nr:ATP-binding cassette domain-containing protein [Rhodanobacteraceae bacterium]